LELLEHGTNKRVRILNNENKEIYNVKEYLLLELIKSKGIPMSLNTIGKVVYNSNNGLYKCKKIKRNNFINGGPNMYSKELLNEIKRLRSEVQQYQHDELTLLKTRKDFNKYFSDMWYEYKKFGHRFILAMVDLNGLHALNRDFSFEAGDEFIVNVSNQLKDLFEDSNIFRIGGDEFMLLKRGNDIDDFNKRLISIKDCEVYSVTTQEGFETESEMFNKVDDGIIKKKKNSKMSKR
jgi:diguanylate cyclase (GGDEF)-like protein